MSAGYLEQCILYTLYLFRSYLYTLDVLLSFSIFSNRFLCVPVFLKQTQYRHCIFFDKHDKQ